MLLKTVISGGQTGADRTALECAKAIGLETGGTAPKGYRTEYGFDKALRDEFGLKESPTYDYAPRTVQNVKDGDVTIWFGKTNSPGYWCTKNACSKHGKEFYENPSNLQLTYLVNTFETINFAGNRESKNPDVVEQVRKAFEVILEIKNENSNRSTEEGT